MYGQLAVDCIAITSSEEDEETVHLLDIDSGTTSPTGAYRWMDVADQVYGSAYQSNYNYDKDEVDVAFIYNIGGPVLRGTLHACNLKPNFAYQMKLLGKPGEEGNELIGYTGRWWMKNLTDGVSQNSNDYEYESYKDDPNNIFEGYLLFDYFITDANGNTILDFEVDSSYHVLWKVEQTGHTKTSEDGPDISTIFDPMSPRTLTYTTNYGPSSETVYGEVERTPVGGKHLPPGYYNCRIVLTEESFHGSSPAGNWAGAMGHDISFTITQYVVPEPPSGTIMGLASFFTALVLYLHRKDTRGDHTAYSLTKVSHPRASGH